MTRPFTIFIALLACVASTLSAQANQGLVPIRIETSAGIIDAELDSVHAPVTVTNFLRYVDAKLFDQGSFFRVVRPDNQPNDSVRIEVIQGGIAKEKRASGFPAIPLERTSVTSLKHVDGTLSMARGGPDSATDQFFITFGAQPELDFGGRRNKDGQGFAAFGRVTSGLEVARAIQRGEANAQALVSPVTIIRIVRR
jgi:peptidyl-prolyl cis-trans isomerase A (cyclophilin A)